MADMAGQNIAGQPVLAREDPLQGDLDLLFQRHGADMQADTPPESNHMMPRESLRGDGISFFVLRLDGQPVAMAAVKRLDATGAELKSMHVLAEHRGRGLSRLMLERLIAEAGAQGFRQLFLETGVQPSFTAARGLYRRAGFVTCAPFGDYRADPNSLFMSRKI